MTLPLVIHRMDALSTWLGDQRAAGRCVGLVPTMGALHDGHLELMRRAGQLADRVIVSVFINPTQFSADEDFDRYPRSLSTDLRRCAKVGIDGVFVPDVDTIYPEGIAGAGVTIDPGRLGTELEGARRPGHFRGVLTVVAKLLGLICPDVAVFGEKDYQQLTLIRAMASELFLQTKIHGCPTVRDTDGLAMSSRNAYLDARERAAAAIIPQALRAAHHAARNGPPNTARVAAEDVLATADADIVDVDYLVIRSPDLITDIGPTDEARMLIAAQVGGTRLIDNTALIRNQLGEI